MKKLFIILTIPLLNFGQIIDYSFVKKLGICRDDGDLVYNDLKDEFRDLLPVCSTGTFTVYEFPPNYYAIFMEGSWWCGQGGCHTSLYKKVGNEFIKLQTDIWGHIEEEHSTKNYLAVFKYVNVSGACDYSILRQVTIENDSFIPGKMLEYNHRVKNLEIHSNDCIFQTYSDTLPYLDFVNTIYD